MKTRWLIAALLCLFPITGFAQPLVPEPPPVIRLKLIPAAEPVPALKYKLLPELRDQTPGNALFLYYRAFSPEWQWYRKEANWWETLDKARETPLKDLPVKELNWVRTSAMLREVDRAARRSYCDWEMKDRVREDGVGLLLPDAQGLRGFGMLLSVRARLEMADGKFENAGHTFQTGFALARHTGEGPTLIQGLVGIAIASMMNKQMETWVQTPGSPNLYWALTDLPMPFIDLRKCLQGERIMLDNILPDLRENLNDPKRPPLAPAQIQRMLRSIAAVTDAPKEGPGLGLLLGAVKYAGAKKFLAEKGWTAEQIDAIPALQAVLMQEVFEYDRFFDMMAKGANLPYPESQKIMNAAEVELKKAVGQSNPLAAPILAKLLLPATAKVFTARARLDRQIAVLRVIEAIRLHAAANGGKLPESLDAVTLVPVHRDPVFDKPFEYRRDGDKAMLSAPPPPGMPAIAGQVIRYELTIGK